MARKSSPDLSIPSEPSSWMDLLAATMLDDTSAETIEAEVRANVPDARGLRLIVQSFEEGNARPVGSVQRAVTARELRSGVHVHLVELRERSSERGKQRVVAWVETSDLDEYDGLGAKPTRGSPYGEARRNARGVRIVLSKRAA
jgi:hypothetical protein